MLTNFKQHRSTNREKNMKGMTPIDNVSGNFPSSDYTKRDNVTNKYTRNSIIYKDLSSMR